MPIRKSGRDEELPDTLRRSPKKAQRTYLKALDNAHREYDSEQAAHRVAIAAVKHSFRKTGDRWEEKDQKGPSDAQAARRGKAARQRPRKTAGGVDVKGSTKDELVRRAKSLDIKNASRMKKEELGRAIASKERSRSRSAGGSRSRTGSGSTAKGARKPRSAAA